jgi:hypothetical protein
MDVFTFPNASNSLEKVEVDETEVVGLIIEVDVCEDVLTI